MRRPRNPRGGLYREAMDIVYGGVAQGTRVMLASALGQQQMNNEQNPWANLDATLRTPAAAAGGEAAARGAEGPINKSCLELESSTLPHRYPHPYRHRHKLDKPRCRA